MKCSRCTLALTGSASKGRTQYYHYYHCSSLACGCRQKAELVNELFVQMIKEYSLDPSVAELFKQVIMEIYRDECSTGKESRKGLIDQAIAHRNRLTKARELLLNGDIDAADYKTIKMDAEHKIMVLEAKLMELRTDFISVGEVERILDSAIIVLTKLDELYITSDAAAKRKIIGSMFPEKFTFEDLQHRTAPVSDAFKVIYMINTHLKGKKMGQKRNFLFCPKG